MRLFLVLFSAALFLLGCSDTQKSVDPNNGTNDMSMNEADASDMTSNPFNPPDLSRPQPEVCEQMRPASGYSEECPVADCECEQDSDCMDGDNGRCRGELNGGVCDYDECFADSDCTTGVCGCDLSGTGANKCMSGNCETDADCPDTGFCSPSLSDCGTSFGDDYEAFYCHTKSDECFDHDDCDTSANEFCAFKEDEQRWTCFAEAECFNNGL